MPYGYGSANRRGPSGPPGGGATSRGSGRDFSPRPRGNPAVVTKTGGEWNPGVGGPKPRGNPAVITTSPVTTGGPPGGGDPRMTYTAPPGGGGITNIDRFKKFISGIPGKGMNWFSGATEDWGDEEIGNLSQVLANMPKYWDLPASLQKAIEAGKNIPFAHGTKTLEDYANLAKTGFQTARTKLIPTAHDWANMFKGKNPFKAEGVFGAVGTKAEDALKAATQYAKGAVLRGGELGKTTGKVFEGMIDPAKAYINRGLTGVIQARVPSQIANQAFNLPNAAGITKAFTEPGLHRIGSRLLPGANIGLGAASAVKHFQDKNYGQALMAGISAIPGPVGYAGLGGELLLGALQKYRQNQGPDTNTGFTEFAAARGGLADLYRHGGFIG